MRSPGFRLSLLAGALLTLALAVAPATAGECPPCLAFDQLDKQIRDGALPEADARRRFAAVVAELDAWFARSAAPVDNREPWVFPLIGYELATAGAEAANGYVATGYDYFDGNRHGGHPSFDLFIADRNQDSLDDRTAQPVTVVAMTGGIVVAAEPAWEAESPRRGGKYLWIYTPASQLLSYYAHNRDLLVGVGDRVAPGTPIATVGRSGFNAAKRRSPTHLHLTVLQLVSGKPRPVDVLSRLKTATTR